MANQVYKATGQVIDIESNEGLAGLRVEARESVKDNLLATADTGENGRFVLTFDLKSMGLKSIPDIFFKVFRSQTLLEGTESSLSWNASAEEDVTILVRKTPLKRKEAKDRVTTKQFLKGVDFVQQSDFIGLLSSLKEKAGTKFDIVKDVLAGSLSKLNIEPVRPSGNIEKNMINNDTDTVKRKLESEKIEVNEVLPFNPRLNRDFLADITRLSKSLKPGQKVNLFEENGKVKSYAVVKEETPAAETGALNETQKKRLKKMEDELKASREDAVQKTGMINKLQEELLNMRKEHGEMQKLFKSKEFVALLKNVGKPGK